MKLEENSKNESDDSENDDEKFEEKIQSKRQEPRSMSGYYHGQAKGNPIVFPFLPQMRPMISIFISNRNKRKYINNIQTLINI